MIHVKKKLFYQRKYLSEKSIILHLQISKWGCCDFLIWFSFLRYRFFDVENENENAISWHLLTSSVNFVLRCCTLAELRSRYRKYLLLSKSRENLPSSSSFLLLMANAALWTWIQQHSTTLQTKNQPKIQKCS